MYIMRESSAVSKIWISLFRSVVSNSGGKTGKLKWSQFYHFEIFLIDTD